MSSGGGGEAPPRRQARGGGRLALSACWNKLHTRVTSDASCGSSGRQHRPGFSSPAVATSGLLATGRRLPACGPASPASAASPPPQRLTTSGLPPGALLWLGCPEDVVGLAGDPSRAASRCTDSSFLLSKSSTPTHGSCCGSAPADRQLPLLQGCTNSRVPPRGSCISDADGSPTHSCCHCPPSEACQTCTSSCLSPPTPRFGAFPSCCAWCSLGERSYYSGRCRIGEYVGERWWCWPRESGLGTKRQVFHPWACWSPLSHSWASNPTACPKVVFQAPSPSRLSILLMPPPIPVKGMQHLSTPSLHIDRLAMGS